MEEIEFWSIIDNEKIPVPLSACEVEIVQTTKGTKKLLKARVIGPDGKIRNLSKFVPKDFELE